MESIAGFSDCLEMSPMEKWMNVSEEVGTGRYVRVG